MSLFYVYVLLYHQSGKPMRYCGVARDLAARLLKHKNRKGAKCLRGREIWGYEWTTLEPMPIADALFLERRIKRLSAADKSDYNKLNAIYESFKNRSITIP